jgi:hypothetical protein
MQKPWKLWGSNKWTAEYVQFEEGLLIMWFVKPNSWPDLAFLHWFQLFWTSEQLTGPWGHKTVVSFIFMRQIRRHSYRNKSKRLGFS